MDQLTSVLEHFRRFSEERVKRKVLQSALIYLFCSGLVALAQAPSGADSTGVATEPLVITWKANDPNSDARFINGMEEKEIFTSQTFLSVVLVSDSGKLAVSVYVADSEKSAGRLEVIPENFHLFRATDKGLSELKRAEAGKMAKSMERHQRVGAALSGFGAGFSKTTATGTATYSDGTTATYSATMPDRQAQTNEINQGQANIRTAQAEGAYLVGEELKRTTLDPGQHTMGRLFFPNQKRGEDLLVRADIGNVRYEVPFHLPGKHEAPIGQTAVQVEGPLPPRQAIQTVPYSFQQTMPAEQAEEVARLRTAADQGDAHAQYNLGIFYEDGRGVPQDYTQALAWYQRAAEQGESYAQNNLAILYDDGHGVPQDYVLATVWFRKAADQGNAEAQCNLGLHYKHGQGVPQSYAEAYFWLDLGAAHMPGESQQKAARQRDDAAARLPPADLSNAQQRAAEWVSAHPPTP